MKTTIKPQQKVRVRISHQGSPVCDCHVLPSRVEALKEFCQGLVEECWSKPQVKVEIDFQI